MLKHNTIIIGGGPAGLSAAGALKQRGIEAIILERNARIGASWESRYERLHLHTIRALSELAHYPIPTNFPRYVSKDLYAHYLRDYARHFDLNLASGSSVEAIRKENGQSSSSYTVLTHEGKLWRARAVVIATGQFCVPFRPAWPGLDDYQGRIIHSADYHTGIEHRGKRVLVIGAGNSGTEIATDLAEQGAESVCISIRTPTFIVPRDFLGIPAQVFGFLMYPFPPQLADRVAAILSRIALGDLRRYGMKPPAWQPFSDSKIPVIDVGFVNGLREGKISISPPVDRFTDTGVIFQNGQRESYDQVILATGFRTGLGRLLRVHGLLNKIDHPMFPSGKPTAHPGLFFIGYTESIRGFLYETNLASRKLALHIQEYLNR